MYQSLLVLEILCLTKQRGSCPSRVYIQDGVTNSKSWSKSQLVWELFLIHADWILLNSLLFSSAFLHFLPHWLDFIHAPVFLNYISFHLWIFIIWRYLNFLKKLLITLLDIVSLVPGTLWCSRIDVWMNKTMQIWRKHIHFINLVRMLYLCIGHLCKWLQKTGKWYGLRSRIVESNKETIGYNFELFYYIQKFQWFKILIITNFNYYTSQALMILLN